MEVCASLDFQVDAPQSTLEDALTLVLLISSPALLVVSQEKFIALPLPVSEGSSHRGLCLHLNSRH